MGLKSNGPKDQLDKVLNENTNRKTCWMVNQQTREQVKTTIANIPMTKTTNTSLKSLNYQNSHLQSSLHRNRRLLKTHKKMARQMFVLALVLFALIGMVSAAKDDTSAPSKDSASGPDAASPPMPDVAVAGPVGEATTSAKSPSSTKSDGGATLHASAAVAAASVAAAGFFF